MVDFADLFRLSDPVANKPYRGEIDMTSEEAWSVSRAEHIPSNRPIVRWAMGGSTPTDVMWTTLAAPLIISSRVTDVLKTGGFSGWDVFPVTVYDKREIEVPNYFILAIKGRCNPVELSRSEVVLREYPGGWFPEFKGAYFQEESWDRSDLFMERPDALGRGTMSRFATGDLVRALRQIRIRTRFQSPHMSAGPRTNFHMILRGVWRTLIGRLACRGRHVSHRRLRGLETISSSVC
jgi:hypothetical protein